MDDSTQLHRGGKEMRTHYVFAKHSGCLLGHSNSFRDRRLSLCSSPRRVFTVRLRGLRTAFLLVAASAAAFGDTLVVPNLQATAAGNVALHVGLRALSVLVSLRTKSRCRPPKRIPTRTTATPCQASRMRTMSGRTPPWCITPPQRDLLLAAPGLGPAHLI